VQSLVARCIGLRQDSSNRDFGGQLWIGGLIVSVTMRPQGRVIVLFLDINGNESYLLYQLLSI
jgi:hypothetical protein